MDEIAFQNKLAELMGEISTLPKAERDKLANMAQQTQEQHAKLRKTVHDLQESLDYLRLSIKYLVFDLEATPPEPAAHFRPGGLLHHALRLSVVEEPHEGSHASSRPDPYARLFAAPREVKFL